MVTPARMSAADGNALSDQVLCMDCRIKSGNDDWWSG